MYAQLWMELCMCAHHTQTLAYFLLQYLHCTLFLIEHYIPWNPHHSNCVCTILCRQAVWHLCLLLDEDLAGLLVIFGFVVPSTKEEVHQAMPSSHLYFRTRAQTLVELVDFLSRRYSTNDI